MMVFFLGKTAVAVFAAVFPRLELALEFLLFVDHGILLFIAAGHVILALEKRFYA